MSSELNSRLLLAGSQEAVLNASSHDQTVNFELILASRQAEIDRQQAQQAASQGSEEQIAQQMAGNAPENLSLLECADRRHRHRRRNGRRQRRRVAFDCRQLRLQRRVGGDQRASGSGERAGWPRSGSHTRCSTVDSSARRVEWARRRSRPGRTIRRLRR